MSNWFEDMSFVWVFVVMDDNICIFIEVDVWIVIFVCFVFSVNDNSFYDFIFFDNVFWCCLFNCVNNYIINVSCFMFRIIKNFNSKYFMCVRVVSYF